MQTNEKIFKLPRDLSIKDVQSLFQDIQKQGQERTITVDFEKLENSDHSGIAFLNYLDSQYKNIRFANVPEKFTRLLLEHSAATKGAPKVPVSVPSPSRFERLAESYLSFRSDITRFFVLLSDEIYHTLRFLRKGRGISPGEIFNQLYFMGYKSFPIVSLITFLVGVTIALTSAAQLRLFGADIYLSTFIGIAMVRELVPLMTGIILAGKVGASITAEISTMKVLEEVDALKTMGIVPERYIMVPRLIAITLAVPLLVAIADFVGIFGGVLVGRFFLGTPPGVFLREMLNVVSLNDFLIGMAKTMVFGWAVVVSSGFKGFFVKTSAEEVGRATTESVVLSIALIIIFDCIFAFLLY